MASSYGICTTGTKRQAEKIDILLDDKIKTMKVTKSSLFPWVRIDELKKQLTQSKYQNHLSWKDLRLFYKNLQLTPDHKKVFDFGVEPNSVIVIKLVEAQKDIQRGVINPYHIFDVTPNGIKNLLLEVQSGLNNGKKPKLADDGTSGTYFLENHQKVVCAIFKPFDEQVGAQNNPRLFTGITGGPGSRRGILSGQGATREVAAYILDEQRFHNVPQTTYVQFFHPSFIKRQQISNPITSDRQQKLNIQKQLKTKHGSLQVFVQHQQVAANVGSSKFDIDEVHKIGILDIRILNCDRNDANILLRKVAKTVKVSQKKQKIQSMYKLIPIDHGLSFPDNFQINQDQMVWMSYPHSDKPFSQKSLKFIQNIDPIKDCKKLREKLGFRQICLRNFRIAQTFLKKMAKAGFTLKQIGKLMYRQQDDDDYYQFTNIKQQQKQQSAEQKKQQKVVDNRSQLQKLICDVENIYFMIKQNGIKSTVNFQIMSTKPRKMEQSLPDLNSSHSNNNADSNQKKQQIKRTSLQKQTKKRQNKQSVIIKTHRPISPHKVRSVSLPNLKITKKSQQTKQQKRKLKKKRQFQDKRFAKKNKQQEWDEVFFHYFEQYLDRFIKEKSKRKKLTRGSRIKSQCIDLSQL